jgi:hypothetical protein
MKRSPAEILYDKTPKPAHETEEGKKRLDCYYAALAQFTHRFALIELAVHHVLAHYTKLPIPAARALLSGARIDETKSRLSRLQEIGPIGSEKWQHLEPVLQELAVITKCRNDILHHGAVWIAEGEGAVTNATMALTAERITSFDFSPEILNDMTSDLRKIRVRLHLNHMGRPTLRGKYPEMQDTPHGPWRYKQQLRPVGKSRKSSHPQNATR